MFKIRVYYYCHEKLNCFIVNEKLIITLPDLYAKIILRTAEDIA